ncbi:MAG: alkaline phosphatase family protein [Planctomycetota bacterium]|jgi:predicted AlkP superfamily phosphohydrolase/phosphomutase
MKLLVIGFDGGTWSVFDDYLLEQCMPNLKKLKDEGCHGILDSTEPPVTPPAWTTCITGCYPGKHGIFAFHKYSFKDSGPELMSSADCRVPNMFQVLSTQGYRVGAINVPFTYPCREVNGITVAGLGCPGTDCDFTYPRDFGDELLADMQDYSVLHVWKRGGPKKQEKNLDWNVKKVERIFRQRVHAARMISRRVNWDILMVQFQNLDKMQHSIWRYVDKESRDEYPEQRDRFFKMFGRLDTAIGELISLAGKEETTVLVVSDHGFGRIVAQIRPNTALALWGYLEPRYSRNAWGRIRKRLTKKIARLKRRRGRRERAPVREDFIWARSKAAVMFQSIDGFMYINVKGRDSGGRIEQADKQEIIEELRDKFSKVRNPVSGEKVFRKVLTPEELFGPGAVDTRKCGDLILAPTNGYWLKLTDSLRNDYIRIYPEGTLGGGHYCEGMYIMSGPGVKRGAIHRTHIVNIAPTIYAILGAKLPTFMDGSVITEAFEKQLNCRYETVSLTEFVQQKDTKAMTPEEEEEVNKRLAALGYLD